MALIRRTPMSLESTARRALNRNLVLESDIAELPLPTTLRVQLRKNYVRDKYFCTDCLEPIKRQEFFDWFDVPYKQFARNAYLYTMRLHTTDCDITFIMNTFIVHIQRFDIFEVNPMSDWDIILYSGLCRFCMLGCLDIAMCKNVKSIVVEEQYCRRLVAGHFILDEIQQSNLWCSRCYTSTLFVITENDNFEEQNMYSYSYTTLDRSRWDVVNGRWHNTTPWSRH